MNFKIQPANQCAGEFLVVDSRQIPLFVVRNERARRYVLRVRPNGTIRLTIPRRGSHQQALAFAHRNLSWLAAELARCTARATETHTWQTGSRLFFRGENVTITTVQVADVIRVDFATERITVSATIDDFRPAIEQHLRDLATRELPARVRSFAAQHALSVADVTVRNQRSRWGSCSRRRTISLNWRLIQTPASVADYIILHELMHLRQMNHSPKFWHEVEQVCPDFRAAEKWLRAHGRLLR